MSNPTEGVIAVDLGKIPEDIAKKLANMEREDIIKMLEQLQLPYQIINVNGQPDKTKSL